MTPTLVFRRRDQFHRWCRCDRARRDGAADRGAPQRFSHDVDPEHPPCQAAGVDEQHGIIAVSRPGQGVVARGVDVADVEIRRLSVLVDRLERGAVVPGAINQDDVARGGLVQRDGADPARVQFFRDGVDHPGLAGGVAPFEPDEHARPGPGRPARCVVQLFLKVAPAARA